MTDSIDNAEGKYLLTDAQFSRVGPPDDFFERLRLFLESKNITTVKLMIRLNGHGTVFATNDKEMIGALDALSQAGEITKLDKSIVTCMSMEQWKKTMAVNRRGRTELNKIADDFNTNLEKEIEVTMRDFKDWKKELSDLPPDQ